MPSLHKINLKKQIGFGLEVAYLSFDCCRGKCSRYLTSRRIKDSNHRVFTERPLLSLFLAVCDF